MPKSRSGFTLVELLIVIVVIGILAAITLVAYNGVQGRARDAAREQALQEIEGGLAMYYAENGQYPQSGGSTTINSGWSTTADASWSTLATALQPYISNLPSDPIATPGANIVTVATSGYDFAYFSNSAGTYCNAGPNQMYLLVYRLETSAPPHASGDSCSSGTGLGPYGSTATDTGNYYKISG